MDIIINYWAVLACGIVSMVLGFVWYGPLFGKKWMEICGTTAQDLERRKEMQKKAGPLYAVQFVLTLLQAWVLAWFIGFLMQSGQSGGVHTAFAIWLAFLMPTVAAGAMWNADAGKVKWAKFLLQAGYYLVLFLIFGLILAMVL